MSDVVISAYSVLSPIGMGRLEFEENLFTGKCGVCDIRGSLVPKNFPVPFAAPLLREIPYTGDTKYIRAAKFLSDEINLQAPECLIDGVVWGVDEGLTLPRARSFLKEREPLPSPTGSKLALKENIGKFFVGEAGDFIQVQNSCVTGATVIGLAAQRIRSGRWRRALVGAAFFGCYPEYFLAMHALSAINVDAGVAAEASCPFSLARNGLVMAEGAGMILLEAREAARERCALPHASVTGFACTSDAWRLTDGREDGGAAAEAMRLAMKEAGVGVEQVDYINAHGTSTKLNDLLETRAVKKAFGSRAYKIPMSSLKSQMGHSLLACGILEGIACTMMLRHQKISPTIGYKMADPECDLDYVPNVARALSLENVMSNNFAFGGQNASLVFRREQ